MKIHPVGTELLLADGEWMDGHDEASSRFSQFADAPKKKKMN
jgi:hypothetical protein